MQECFIRLWKSFSSDKIIEKNLKGYDYVKLKLPKFADYTKRAWKERGAYYDYFHKDGIKAGKDFTLNLLKVDKTIKKDYYIRNVKKYHMETIKGKKVIIAQCLSSVDSKVENQDSGSRCIYVFYEKEGYVLEMFTDGGISNKDIRRMVEGISLEKCEKKEAEKPWNLSESVKFDSDMDKPVTEPVPEYPISEDRIMTKDKRFDASNDQLNELKESIQKAANKDGTLKSYIRETYKEGDGKTEPYARVISRKRVKLKFDEAQGYEYPIYFKETNGGSDYGLKYLDAGEEQTYHYGFIIDEDLLDSSYIKQFDGGFMECNGPLIKITE